MHRALEGWGMMWCLLGPHPISIPHHLSMVAKRHAVWQSFNHRSVQGLPLFGMQIVCASHGSETWNLQKKVAHNLHHFLQFFRHFTVCSVSHRLFQCPFASSLYVTLTAARLSTQTFCGSTALGNSEVPSGLPRTVNKVFEIRVVQQWLLFGCQPCGDQLETR